MLKRILALSASICLGVAAPLCLIFEDFVHFLKKERKQQQQQLWTKFPTDLVRNVLRNSKITVLLQERPLLWSYSKKMCENQYFTMFWAIQ